MKLRRIARKNRLKPCSGKDLKLAVVRIQSRYSGLTTELPYCLNGPSRKAVATGSYQDEYPRHAHLALPRRKRGPVVCCLLREQCVRVRHRPHNGITELGCSTSWLHTTVRNTWAQSNNRCRTRRRTIPAPVEQVCGTSVVRSLCNNRPVSFSHWPIQPAKAEHICRAGSRTRLDLEGR